MQDEFEIVSVELEYSKLWIDPSHNSQKFQGGEQRNRPQNYASITTKYLFHIYRHADISRLF